MLFAISVALILLPLAALAVDLGNVFNRQKLDQSQADLAALAAGSFLPADSLTPKANDPAVKAAASYLLKNAVASDDGAVLPSADTLAQYLVNSSMKNTYGQIYYGHFASNGALVPSVNEVTVRAPRATVNYSFARTFGVSEGNVQRQATASIRSPGSVGSTLPFFAYNGCDWGSQTIDQPTSNPAAPGVALDSQSSSKLSVDDATSSSPNATPNHVALNDTTTPLSLTGSGFMSGTTNNVTKLGFFLDDGTTYYSVPPSAFLSETATKITFNLSNTALSTMRGTTGVYYLRVQDTDTSHGSTTSTWSSISAQQPYVSVGDATLYCRGGKNQGNFGSLEIARADSSKAASDGWLPRNIAYGTDKGVSLAVYTAAISSSSCNRSDANAVFTDTTPTLNANCVTTDTGFAQNSATTGLLGGRGITGKLASSTAGCGGAPTRVVQGTSINNELLTCYLSDSSVNIGSISSQYYTGGVKLSASIYSSPRFFWVPVISSAPGTGKSSYPIIGFRPGFLTGEAPSATKISPTFIDDPTTNGLVVSTSGVDSFRLTFINPNALPPVQGSGTPADYTGSGPKVLLLTR